MAKKKNTGDWIKRCIVMIAFWMFLGYFFTMFINMDLEVFLESTELTKEVLYTLLWLIVFICLYFLNVYGIFCIFFPYSRFIALCLWLGLIIVSMYLPNDGANGIVLGDMVAVLGVFCTVLFPTNILVTEKSKEAKRKSEEVIIEA